MKRGCSLFGQMICAGALPEGHLVAVRTFGPEQQQK